MAVATGRRAILIAGPTASGKSALALRLAERHRGVVVNADAMQVYGDLSVLTARPSAAETARVPHRLFGHVDAAVAYSVGRWLGEIRVALAEAGAEGLTPIVVGGTGLYLKALTEGLSDIPAVPAAVRERLRHDAATMTPGALHARLTERDPQMAARLRPSDPQRILRALEIVEATGRSLLAFQTERAPPVLPWHDVDGIFLDVPRATLAARIDSRFDVMMEQGALEEVAILARRRLAPSLPAMRAVGVPQLVSALDRPETLPLAITAAKLASRQYAKRQVTYARHQLPGLSWVEPPDAPALLA